MLMALPENHLEAFRKAIPFKRFGKPSELADAIMFFASDHASYITGQTLSVSGGLTMFSPDLPGQVWLDSVLLQVFTGKP
jgi:2-hydroxycyclohexanecarboxyl-CoA dehydrogenase